MMILSLFQFHKSNSIFFQSGTLVIEILFGDPAGQLNKEPLSEAAHNQIVRICSKIAI